MQAHPKRGKKAALPKITAAKTDIDEDAQAPLDTNQDALTVLPEQKNNEQSTQEARDIHINLAKNQTPQKKQME